MQSPPASRRVPTRAALTWHALAALAYLALSLWFLRPIASLYASHIAPDLGDPLFNVVILKWGVHQLSQGLPDFWNAPFGALRKADDLRNEIAPTLQTGGKALADPAFARQEQRRLLHEAGG